MNRKVLILVIAYEVISLVFIYRLWTRKQRPGIIERSVLKRCSAGSTFRLDFLRLSRDTP
jgi:hypothetical protein